MTDKYEPIPGVMDTIDVLRKERDELIRDVEELLDAIKWIAQTNHQGNHQDEPGTFRDCPKNTCTYADEVIAMHSSAGEKK